jgi:hypothetical protein
MKAPSHYSYPSIVITVSRDYLNKPLSCVKLNNDNVSKFISDDEKGAEPHYPTLLQWKKNQMTTDRTLVYNTSRSVVYERIFIESRKLGLLVQDNSGQLVPITDPKLLQSWVTMNEDHRMTFQILYTPFEDAADSNTKRWSIEAETMRRSGYQYTESDDIRKTAPTGFRNVTGGGVVFLVSRAISDIRKYANYYRKKYGKPIISVLVKTGVKGKKRRKYGEFNMSLVVHVSAGVTINVSSSVDDMGSIDIPVSFFAIANDC